MTNQRGFTLIEMAIVLAIIGLLVGGGVMALGPVLDKTRITQTNSNLDQIENALVLFAIRNNRLPCPADGSMTNTVVGYGLEQIVSTGASPYTCSTSGTSAKKSVIPWKTLGLDETFSVDGWGNRISYFPSSNIIGTDTLVDYQSSVSGGCMTRAISTSRTDYANCDPTPSADQQLFPTYPYGNYIPVYSISGTACSTELTSPQPDGSCPVTTTSTCTSAPATTTPASPSIANCAGNRAAYVLISHGKSGWYGYNRAGHQIAPTLALGITNLKYYNQAGTAGPSAGNFGFVQGNNVGAWPATDLNYFDDIVRWRSPGMIIQLCGSGACGNP